MPDEFTNEELKIMDQLEQTIMKKQKVIKSHELAAMLLALPNLPVYRHCDDEDDDECGGLKPVATAEKITACDEDKNPTIDCIVLGSITKPWPYTLGKTESVAEPSNATS